MKNLASRVLALIIVLSVFLMPVSALAAEHNAVMLTVGDLELVVDGETIALPVYLQIGGGVELENERGYVVANVQTATQTAISALAAVENAEVKAYLNGMSYGLVMPLEQVTGLITDAMAASDISIEDLMAELEGFVSPEMQAAITDMVNTIPALMADAETIQAQANDPVAYWTNMLGAKIETIGAAESVTIFDVETQAVPMTVVVEDTTLSEVFNNIGTISPAYKEFFDAYIALLNQILAESGEDEMTIEELFGMISYSVNGTLKQAEEGYVSDLDVTVTVTVEDSSESLVIPTDTIYLSDAAGWYTATVIEMDVDGEIMYMSVYADDYAEEGVDYTNYEISTNISDAGSETADMAFTVSLYTAGNETDGTTYGIDAYVEEYGIPVSIGGYYHAYPAEVTAEGDDSYSGALAIYADDGDMSVEAYLGTNLLLTSVPEGELLTFTSSINPLEADEAALEQLGTDAMTVLYQGLGILMSDPDIAALINNFAG